jgi:small subunit ribosomal protein S17
MSEMLRVETGGTAQAGRRGRRRTRVGVVVGAVRSKTVKVRMERLVQHAKYGKYLRRRCVLHAHDENNQAKPGDVVEIVECRPMSKTKSWRLAKVLRRSAET